MQRLSELKIRKAGYLVRSCSMFWHFLIELSSAFSLDNLLWCQWIWCLATSMVYIDERTKSEILVVTWRWRSKCRKFSSDESFSQWKTFCLASGRWNRSSLLYRSNDQCFTTWNLCSSTYIWITYRHPNEKIYWKWNLFQRSWWTNEYIDHCSTIWKTNFVSILVKCWFTWRSKRLVYDSQSNLSWSTWMGNSFLKL